MDRTAPLLDQADAAYRRRDWRDAFALYEAAAAEAALAVADLERMATIAGMLNRDDLFVAASERAYDLARAEDQTDRAARLAFFLSFRLIMLGETGRAGAWRRRAQDLVAASEREISASGFLLLDKARGEMTAGDPDAAEATMTEAIAIGERTGDAECATFSRTVLAQVLIRLGRAEDALAALDEAMLAASGGALGPVMTGLVYCNVIAACNKLHEHGRSREWTGAMARWCDAQPQMVEFHGICRIHRAEVLELCGAWSEAVAEAQRAAAATGDGPDAMVRAGASYQQGEVARMQGRYGDAERHYTEASRCGRDPQPGLALLRLAQGRAYQALSALRRAVESSSDDLMRARLLPAMVEVALEAKDAATALASATDMARIAATYRTVLLGAMADQAEGTVALAEGRAAESIEPLRRAFDTWNEFGAPFIAARVRMCLGAACAALGDEDGARLERQAAMICFAELGAAPDLARAAALVRQRPGGRDALSPRESEVMRRVADGETNHAIAEALGLSEKTVERHVSNIFDKFGVSSRAAATAHALRNDLLGMGDIPHTRRDPR